MGPGSGTAKLGGRPAVHRSRAESIGAPLPGGSAPGPFRASSGPAWLTGNLEFQSGGLLPGVRDCVLDRLAPLRVADSREFGFVLSDSFIELANLLLRSF